jgi:lipid II isoglutaminyl synthase (glutamine-hydrolysing)
MWLISTLITKITYLFIKTFSGGSGFTWPGHLVLQIFPNITSLVKYPKGVILVSGTNGKTTTSKLITHLLESSGIKVTCNKTGANLLNGIVSAALLDTTLLGFTKGDLGVFEVDEFTLPVLLQSISPSALILLNLSRDQLDRYGETDIIFEKWKSQVALLSSDTLLVLDGDQKEFKALAKDFPGTTLFFDSDPRLQNKTKLLGDFNAKNVNAAVLTLQALGFEENELESNLANFGAAYGRGEVIEKFSKTFTIFLAKNPASFNENMELLSYQDIAADSILFILNDNIPDGRDVSWFYDIEPSRLKKACEGKNIYVSGTRCLDMSIRLHYAGVLVSPENISENLVSLLKKISSKDIVVFPNYSAMLELREVLIGRKIL